MTDGMGEEEEVSEDFFYFSTRAFGGVPVLLCALSLSLPLSGLWTISRGRSGAASTSSRQSPCRAVQSMPSGRS